ncbi:ABC transporter permease subunit [Gorillibacterium sp. sgz500922]|uniref:ABC transporter permease subunit n=1 Tax=Gorillibacterium sp. sgz500922 TaxID=3446694 RepID=UPI003F67044F
MNMLRQEWRSLGRSTLTWTLSLAATAVLLLALFPGFSRDAADFSRMLDSYPEAVRKALGVTVDTMTTLTGYYAFVLLYVSLAGAIQAMNLGLGLLSRETREKTADFLLTKPVTRSRVVTAKLGAALLALLVTNLGYQAAALAMAASVADRIDYGTYALLTLTLPLIQLVFFALGFILAAALPRIRSVLTLSLGLVLGFFVIGMVDSIVGERAGRYLSPFRYYDRSYILGHGSYESEFALLTAALVLLLTAGAYLLYRRKDIHAV